MSKKRTTQFKNMPLYCIMKGLRWFNTHTGKYLSNQELLAYTEGNTINKEAKQQVIKEHWTNKYYGN